MKFTLQANQIRAAVEATAAIAPGEGKRPQLESTLIVAHADGKLEVAGTNLADALWFTLNGATDVVPGKLFVPSVNLLRIVKQADDRLLSVSWDETKGQAVFSFGGTRIKLPVELPQDFPNMQRFDPALPAIKLPMHVLMAMTKRVNFAVMSDFGTRALAGVCIEAKTKSLRLTTTDGIRMAVVERDIDNTVGLTGRTIVPPIAPKYLKTFSNEDADDIEVQFSSTAFSLRGTRGELTRRAIVGHYPDYDIEKQLVYQNHIEVDTRAFRDALETASLLKVTSATTCEFNWTSKGLLVEAASGIDGNVRAEMPCAWPYPDFSIRLDAGRLADAVKAADAEKLDLSFGDDRQPALLREVNDGSLLYLYAISPKF